MKLKSIVATLCLLVLVISAFSAIGYYRAARKTAILEHHLRSFDNVAETSEHLEKLLRERDQRLARLASATLVVTSLAFEHPRPVPAVDRLLAKLQAEFPNSRFFLLDRQGNQLSYSGPSGPGAAPPSASAIAPFFQDMLRNPNFVGLAADRTSSRRYLLIGKPVPDPSGLKVNGVAAAMFSLEEIGRTIEPNQYQGIITLTGPSGRIMFSNHARLENRLLWQVQNPGKIAGPEPQHRHPPTTPDWSGFRKINLHQAAGPTGGNYSIYQERIDLLPGWDLTYLNDSSAFTGQLSIRLARDIGLFLAAILLLIGLFVFLIYRVANRQIREKKELELQLRTSRNQLQEQVAQQTEALRTTNEELLLEMKRHREATEELAQTYKTKELLNRILGLALKGSSLQDLLNDFMEQASAYSELGLLPKGALFLVDEDDPGYLILKAHYCLEQPFVIACSRVKFGHCLCGRAASEGKVLFSNCLDDRHDNTFDGVAPHGHYCIPIISPDRELIGLYNVYTKPDIPHNQHVEDFLVTLATALAGIILFQQANQQLLESEEKHRAITSTAQEAIITADQQANITFWNPAATTIFGYSEEEAVGANLHRLITPARFLADAEKAFAHFVKTGQGPLLGQTVEIAGLRKDGSEIEIELSLSALRHQQHWTALSILRDISGRKKNEEEKAQLQTQLRQAQKMEAIGTLAGGIAHDFNNILSSILGFAELVREELPDGNEDNVKDIDQVIKAGNRAKELVRQILTFSRQHSEESVPIQISLIVKESLKLLRSSLPSAIEIRQMISDGNLTVFADPSQIQQVLMNLCTNSFRAMRDKGGVLEVRLESYTPDATFSETYPGLRAGRFACLTVRDSGFGMDSSILPRIFEPYFSTNKKEDGTGLGLAMVHGIVKRLGGVIEVSSTVGVGSTFRIYLPVAGKPDLPQTDLDTEDLPRGSERILLVDDELPILELSSRMLSSLGYQVTFRTSSIEALELFRHHPDRFDLIITDQNMPNMTGTSMAAEIATIRPAMPIILCTGYADLDLGKQIRSANNTKVIMKPIAKSQLAETVRQMLDDKEPTENLAPQP